MSEIIFKGVGVTTTKGSLSSHVTHQHEVVLGSINAQIRWNADNQPIIKFTSRRVTDLIKPVFAALQEKPVYTPKDGWEQAKKRLTEEEVVEDDACKKKKYDFPPAIDQEGRPMRSKGQGEVVGDE